VIERALINLSALNFLARLSLIVKWVILLFFPTMRSHAGRLQDTTFFILADEGSRFPVWAEIIRIIIKQLWFSSEILPIMSVITLSFVVFFVEGAPFCFKIELVKIRIFLHEMNDSGLNISL
jgi:hypothetical protein